MLLLLTIITVKVQNKTNCLILIDSQANSKTKEGQSLHSPGTTVRGLNLAVSKYNLFIENLSCRWTNRSGDNITTKKIVR